MVTPRYGDIIERNGVLVEFTPVGYMPVSPTRSTFTGGMLTMPSDTITPSPTGDVIVKPAPVVKTPAPVPAPTPAPTPVIQPGGIMQPVVKQPPVVLGQTDPFDPAGGPVGTISTVPTAPSPAVTPVGPIENVQTPLEETEAPSVVETLFSEYFPSQTQATVQTAPIGTPSTPPKQMPGESGPFDPNATPPVPTTTPTPETELAPPKPLPDTKDVAPVAPTTPATFTFFQGAETGDANPAALYNRADATQSSVEDLQEYFNADSSGMLRQAFGDFDNYLAYMTEREQLIQSGDYDVGNWAEQGVTEAGLTQDQMMLFEGEDLTVDPSDPTQNIQNIERSVNTSRQTAYDRWVNSEANQALLQKYGVNSTIYNQDGDRYEWNGSAYVKTMKVDDHASVGDYMQIGIGVALGAALGPVLGGALTGGGTGAAAAGATGATTTTGAFVQGAVNQAIGSAVAQGVTTGSIDASQLATAAITGGIGGVADGIASGDLAGTAASNAIKDLSEVTGLSVNDTTSVVEGILNGAVTGEDIEGIALNAVEGFTAGQIKNVLQDTLGDEVDIENVFDESTTTIPTEALDPLVDTLVGAAFEGEIEETDILRSLVEYAQEGGSFGFLDPGLDLPDFDIDFDLLSEFETPEEIKAIEDTVRAAGSEVEDITRAVGSFIDDEIIQPIRDALPDETPEEIKAIEDIVRAAGSALEDVVRDAGSEAEDITRAVGSYIDDEIIQPIREMLPEINLPEGPDIDLPSINLPSLSFPSISIGSLGGAGGVAKEYQRTDPGGITYDPTLPELYLIQPNRSGMLV
jgi:hypothetical protein